MLCELIESVAERASMNRLRVAVDQVLAARWRLPPAPPARTSSRFTHRSTVGVRCWSGFDVGVGAGEACEYQAGVGEHHGVDHAAVGSG